MAEYFNTTHERAPMLHDFRTKAATQDESVAALFRSYVAPMSPSEAHRLLRTRAPLTSIRRAITNLTASGVLVRTAHKVSGPYGRPEYRWKLRVEPMQGRLL